MKLKDIAALGIYFLDKNRRRIGSFRCRTISPLKYGEAMANGAVHCKSKNGVFQLLNEKPIGAVNHFDTLAAARFMLSIRGTGIFKHTGVCGAAYGFEDKQEEYKAASEVDEVARFGGIISTPLVTCESAREMVGIRGQKKQDSVVALDFEKGAVEILLAAKNPPLVFKLLDKSFDIPKIDIQEGLDGKVLQERIPKIRQSDLYVIKSSSEAEKFPAKDILADKVLRDVIFGFNVIDTRFSNSIGFVMPTDKGTIAVGISGGPSDRISAAYSAMEKVLGYLFSKYLRLTLKEIPDLIDVKLYMVSDGFFPDTGALKVATPKEIKIITNRISYFPYQTQREDFLPKETLELLTREGFDSVSGKLRYIAEKLKINVPIVLNPGGSKRDEDVIKYARSNGMTMLITERDGSHLRCFKHTPQSCYEVS